MGLKTPPRRALPCPKGSSVPLIFNHLPDPDGLDTVEVWGSSPHVPTIVFNYLQINIFAGRGSAYASMHPIKPFLNACGSCDTSMVEVVGARAF